jgi:hypothetical protein
MTVSPPTHLQVHSRLFADKRVLSLASLCMLHQGQNCFREHSNELPSSDCIYLRQPLAATVLEDRGPCTNMPMYKQSHRTHGPVSAPK